MDDITFRSLQVLLPLHHTSLAGIDNTTHLPPHFITDLAYKVTGERERERERERKKVNWSEPAKSADGDHKITRAASSV